MASKHFGWDVLAYWRDKRPWEGWFHSIRSDLREMKQTQQWNTQSLGAYVAPSSRTSNGIIPLELQPGIKIV